MSKYAWITQWSFLRCWLCDFFTYPSRGITFEIIAATLLKYFCCHVERQLNERIYAKFTWQNYPTGSFQAFNFNFRLCMQRVSEEILTYLCKKWMLLVGALLWQEVQCASMIITTVLSSKIAHMTCIIIIKCDCNTSITWPFSNVIFACDILSQMDANNWTQLNWLIGTY